MRKTHDENQLQNYDIFSYGRFAITNSGSPWFGDLKSSHPMSTRTGWYWGINNGGQLIISPRGAQTDLELLKNPYSWIIDDLARYLIRQKLLARNAVLITSF